MKKIKKEGEREEDLPSSSVVETPAENKDSKSFSQPNFEELLAN